MSKKTAWCYLSQTRQPSYVYYPERRKWREQGSQAKVDEKGCNACEKQQMPIGHQNTHKQSPQIRLPSVLQSTKFANLVPTSRHRDVA